MNAKKSLIMTNIATTNNIKVVDIKLSTLSSPTDVQGIPYKKEA